MFLQNNNFILMQNKVRSNFYHPRTQEPEYHHEDITFQNFMLLVQLKNHNKVKEKQIKIQQYRQLKDRLQNKIKIIPNCYAQGLQEYDQKLNEEVTSRRFSMLFPSNKKSQIQFPRIKKGSHLQILPNLKKQYRLDQINSIRSFSFRFNSESSIERRQPAKPKILLKRHKTDFVNRQQYLQLKAQFEAKRIYKSLPSQH